MNFAKALQPYNTAAFADVTLTEGVFSVKICEDNIESQQYAARVSAFARDAGKKHPMFDPSPETRNQFFTDRNKGTITDDVLSYFANVILVDWELKGDDGKPVEFTPENIAAVFASTDAAQRNASDRIVRKLLNAAYLKMFFTQDALKN